MKKIISVSHQMKSGVLDDDYTLYDNGEVLHEFDKSIYPGGSNLSEKLKVDDLNLNVKERLLSSASNENKEQVRNILKM
ncbi:MAG: hypothetical protein R2750_12925 [Bacteroidales bacterium]